MKRSPIAHVVFPRPSATRPVTEFVWDAVRAVAKSRALELANTIAAQAPLGVAATLRSARIGVEEGQQAAFQHLVPEIHKLMVTEDAREGVMSFMQRRAAQFKGR